jgi:hypothetical protein
MPGGVPGANPIAAFSAKAVLSEKMHVDRTQPVNSREKVHLLCIT